MARWTPNQYPHRTPMENSDEAVGFARKLSKGLIVSQASGLSPNAEPSGSIDRNWWPSWSMRARSDKASLAIVADTSGRILAELDAFCALSRRPIASRFRSMRTDSIAFKVSIGCSPDRPCLILRNDPRRSRSLILSGLRQNISSRLRNRHSQSHESLAKVS